MGTINKAIKKIDNFTRTELLPVTGRGIRCSVEQRKLLALPPKLGGVVFQYPAKYHIMNMIFKAYN